MQILNSLNTIIWDVWPSDKDFIRNIASHILVLWYYYGTSMYSLMWHTLLAIFHVLVSLLLWENNNRPWLNLPVFGDTGSAPVKSVAQFQAGTRCPDTQAMTWWVNGESWWSAIAHLGWLHVRISILDVDLETQSQTVDPVRAQSDRGEWFGRTCLNLLTAQRLKFSPQSAGRLTKVER